MHLLAPAKLNLHLHVGPRRPDGFHPLRTWMCTTALFDRLSVVATPESGVRLECDRPDLPCDRTNLVVRAAEALLAEAGAVREGPSQRLGATIRLEKRIPLGAGLGGGSSDAARALLGLNRLWRMALPAGKLEQLAACLGSDLPFFLHGSSSICRGRGEQVSPARPPVARWAVLILPAMPLSTAEVYRQFDRLSDALPAGKRADALEDEPPWAHWATLAAEQLLPRLGNDLEPAAFSMKPELAELRQGVERIVRRPIRMSGSGSSLFTLYDRPQSCKEAAERMAADARVRTVAVELAPEIDDDLNASQGTV